MNSHLKSKYSNFNIVLMYYIIVSILTIYATYKNGDSTQSFYVVKDDKYLYIAAIKGSIYKKLPTKIYGYTKTIPNELKKLTVDLYASSDYNEVTDQTFYNYFGYYYIDTYKSPLDDVIGFSIIISIVFIIGLGFIISYISKNKHNKKVFNEYDIENLKLEIDSNDTIINHMGKSYLTKEKLICYSSKLLIIDLKNIIWIYPHTLRSNGRDYNSLVAVNKKGKTMTVTSYSTANRRAKESFDEFYQSIINRNKDILYGYTTENMDKVDEIINNRKV